MIVVNKLALIASLSLLIACGAPEDREQAYLGKAQAYYNEKNYD